MASITEFTPESTTDDKRTEIPTPPITYLMPQYEITSLS
jgi:hypothetical protein